MLENYCQSSLPNSTILRYICSDNRALYGVTIRAMYGSTEPVTSLFTLRDELWIYIRMDCGVR